MNQENFYITRINFNHYTVYTDIEIAASAEKVWAALADFDNTATWSSTFFFHGTCSDGAHIVLEVPFAGRTNRVEHDIFVEQGSHFGWNDTRTAGAADNHIFKVEPLGENRCRLIHSDKLEGGMAWLMAPIMFNMISKNLYMTFNRDLKAYVESTTSELGENQ